ncbi:hypothetical protein NTGBS_1020002 [Candidatus Nitrotoga sp. BS]|nr:hypothetical protein NTGBS_1020002 [Candidatus Nitrotoga sp. BS]
MSRVLPDGYYHLLIETPEGTLSLGMRQLNGVYTQRFQSSSRASGASVPRAIQGDCGGSR